MFFGILGVFLGIGLARTIILILSFELFRVFIPRALYLFDVLSYSSPPRTMWRFM